MEPTFENKIPVFYFCLFEGLRINQDTVGCDSRTKLKTLRSQSNAEEKSLNPIKI